MQLTAAILAALLSASHAQDLQCRKFSDIYPTGTELCEKMWDGAFVVSDNYTASYTMWHFEDQNPNEAVSQTLHPTGNTSVCNLQYFHKTLPTPEGPDFTECHPWKNEACCTIQTADATNLNTAYGPTYRWDRCGALSPACERFFVQEACFYECSPHIGLYRKFGGHACNQDDPQCTQVYDPSDPTHNTWQVHQMPIRKDYCDSWLLACANDLFCASGGGSYFECARIAPSVRVPVIVNTTTVVVDNEKTELSDGIIGLIVVLGLVAVALVIFLCCVVCREKAGKPMFQPLTESKGGKSDIRLSSVAGTSAPAMNA
ncbi:hypothetical protein AAMO2058_000122400 [Amorphochlora amoebiformis]